MNDISRSRRIFEETLRRPAAEREGFARDACGDDEPLLATVLRLLAADDIAGEFLSMGPGTGGGPEPVESIEVRGEQIGGYHLVRLISTGGMGAVYEAEQDRPRRRVALKLLAYSVARPDVRRRLLVEAELLGRLRHPNIVEVYEAGTHDAPGGTVPYFVMALVEGGIGITVYARRATLDVEARLRLFMSVCDAVHYGHQRGVVHRDLKPANVLVGEDGVPKVIDFGVARCLDLDLAVATVQTNRGDMIGTLSYMSPEQCRGRADAVDARTDVYALGVMLYELLSRRLPYAVEGDSPFAIPRAILESDPVPLSSVDHAMRGDLETIVQRAMEKAPDRRYQSVHELALDIERHLAGEPIEARRDQTWYVTGRFLARHRRTVAVIVLFALVLVVSAVVLAASLVRERRARSLADDRAASLSRQNYFNSISLAESAMAEGDMPWFDQLMESCPPALRHWEWDLLRARADPCVTCVTSGVSRITRHATLGLVITRADGSLATFDPATCGTDELARVGTVPEGGIATVSPDGTRVAVGLRDGPGYVTDLSGDRMLMELAPGGSGGLVFTPDGQQLVVATVSGDVDVWSATGQRLHRLIGHDARVTAVAVDPRGRMAATGSDDDAVCIWDLDEGRLRHRLETHTERVEGLVFGPDGSRLYSGGWGGRVLLWDTASGQLLERFDRTDDRVIDLSLSADGRSLLATAKLPRNVHHLYDYAEGRLIRSVASRGAAAAVLLEGDCRAAAVTSSGALRVCELEPVRWRAADAHSSWVCELAVSPDGLHVASAGADHAIRIWNAADGAVAASIDAAHTQRIWSLAFDAGSARLASGDLEGTVRTWGVPGGEPLDSVQVAGAAIVGLAWSPDGERLIAAFGDDRLIVWRPGGDDPTVHRADQAGLWSVRFAAGGTQVVTGGRDGSIAIRDAGSLAVLQRIDGVGIAVRDAAPAGDLGIVIGALTDGSVAAWDAETHELRYRVRLHTAPLTTLHISSDGRRAITVAWNEPSRLIDTMTGQPLLTLPTEGELRVNLAPSPDWSIFAVSNNPLVEVHTAPKTRAVSIAPQPSG